ncbi:MAG: FkbM family methyltransferase [Chitinophagaceae bacterium]|nr:FkbM family methyltransferase [Chitinophagaceae bacterium]
MNNRIRRVADVIGKFKFSGFHYLMLEQLNKFRLLKGVVGIKFPGVKHRLYLRPGTSDFKLFRNIFISGEYDINLPFIPETIIDGGGNIGMAAIIFANRYPHAKIITIEPEDSNFELLQKNVSAYKNIIPLKGGIWRSSSYLKIINPNSGKWAFRIEETSAPDENSIKGFSIDDIIKQQEWRNADLVKLDIEGSEKEVFEHNPGTWLNSAKGLIIELHDWLKPNCSDAVCGAVKRYNFRRSERGENVIFVRES